MQPLPLDWAQAAGVELAVLRLDLLDPLISGNKWFKLSQHLAAAQACDAAGVISLGGAHSNHLHALAAAGKRFAFNTVGLLRGHPQQTPTISDLQAFGMQLHWLGYAGYRARYAADFWLPWQAQYPHFYTLPEGGGGLSGALGCMCLVQQVREQLPALGWDDYDAWWLAAGTGTTLAGLLLGEAAAHPVHAALAVPADHAGTAVYRQGVNGVAPAGRGRLLCSRQPPGVRPYWRLAGPGCGVVAARRRNAATLNSTSGAWIFHERTPQSRTVTQPDATQCAV